MNYKTFSRDVRIITCEENFIEEPQRATDRHTAARHQKLKDHISKLQLLYFEFE